MRYLWPVPALALCVLLPWLPGVPVFWITLLNYIGISAIVVVGLVVLTGIGGMTSFGQASFLGFGAYTTAILSAHAGLSPWLALPVAITIAAVAALLIGAITLRLSGHYLALGTIAWNVALYYTFANLDLFGRNDGISGIPPLTFFGAKLIDGRLYFSVIWVGVVLACLATGNLLDSRAGRAVRALRGGAVAAASFGVDTPRARMLAFVYAAVLAAFAGWLYAHLQRSVNPTPFGLNASIEYLLMAVVGGAAHVPGALLGAGLVTIVNDRLQDILPRLLGAQGNYETIVFGALLVIVLQAAPEGLWPHVARIRPRRHRVRPDAPNLTIRTPLPSGTPILQVERLRKNFGGLIAVNDIDFAVAAGEIVGLIGPNGAGKSTTFNLLTGVATPSAGSVRFCGRSLVGLPARAIARLGIARSFQHVKLVPTMSVIENVAIGAHLRGRAGALAGLLRLDRAEEAQLFAEAARQLARVGLSATADRPATSLPLGQQRIVEIARALCLDPVLLLLDEPAAGLRHNEKTELAALLHRLREEGVAILLVEHDMDFVMTLTDRLVVMDFGTKLAEGPADRIRNDPAVIEAYLGKRRVKILEIDDVHVAYGGIPAVTGLSLSVEAGSIVTVIGPNGAGKSTLLNAVMGVLPSRGAIRFEGSTLSGTDVAARVQAGMSLVPEKRELFASMSVEDNLRLGAFRFRSEGHAAAALGLEHIFALFPRLKERRRQHGGTLSGGERQMLAMGRALMARPRLLMLDEPSLGLAPLIVRDIFRTITELRGTGVAILLVEQNARAALQVADHCYVLETGRVTLEGDSAALTGDRRIVEMYLGHART